MGNDAVLRKKEIKSCAKAAVIFVLFTVGASQLLSVFLPIPSKICDIIGMLLGTLLVMRGSCRPEKGTLMQVTNKMTGTCFAVVLGVFMLGKLLSMAFSLVVMGLFVNEGNADILQGISTVEDNLFLSFLFLGIVTPFCEEAVFRGCIGRTCKKHGVWFGLIMSSIFFALYHCNLPQLMSTFLPGVVLFYVAMNYSILWSMLLHFINNGVMAIGSSALQKYCPDTFFTNYGEYIIEALLIAVAAVLWKKNNSTEKVKAFLREPRNEEGAYRAAMGNMWFILLILAMAVVTGGMLLMLSGNIPALPAG